MTSKPVTRRRFFEGAAAIMAAPTIGGRLEQPWGAPSRNKNLSKLAGAPRAPGAPEDESYWGRVQTEFVLDRSAAYLNAAGVAPAPRATLDSLLADTEFRNRLPARHLWSVLEPRVESVRRQLAAALSCDAEELALTRGATEAMEVVQMGLDLGRGDEVLTTDHDFFRMLNSWDQRVRRDGITLTSVEVPTPPKDGAELVAVFERAITPRTKVIAFCHITNVNGQIYPVRAICDMARSRGIMTLVDGAQAFGHIDVEVDALGCDFYAGSLHKYALAPLGTGFLFVRRERIPEVWPLNPTAHAKREDIRKFEDVGTHQAAPHNSVAEALRFRATHGQAAITSRLQYLTTRWVDRVAGVEGVELFNRFEPDHTCGIATVGLLEMEPRELSAVMWSRFGIVTRPVNHAACNGVRASPHIYNTLDEIDRFSEAILTLNRERRTAP